MDDKKVSEMWADLQHAEVLPRGTVLSGCEPELQELMRQIDAMVQSKRSEWERERQTLQARLEVRQQEYNIQRGTLKQKHAEVGQLRAQVEVLEKNSRETSSQYEIQLSSVRTEVDSMRKEYEKLHKRYNQRREKLAKASKDDMAAGDAKTAQENRKLAAKLDDCKRKSQDLDQEKRIMQHQVESLESQTKMLEEKLSLSQQQSCSYQSQLDRRREMLDSTETNMKSQVAHLESQLQRARDMINSQDTQLSRLRSSYDEAIKAQRRALEEKEQVETELRKTQQASLALEEELHNIQLNSSAKEEVLRRTQTDMTRLNVQINQLQDQLTEKDNLVGSLEEEAPHGDQHSAMKEDLRYSKAQLKLLKKSEQGLQQEVAQLKEQLDHLKRECVLLNKQLGSKVTEMKKLEKYEIQKLKQELSKLQSELCEVKGSHHEELESMKQEMNSALKEAQQKSLAVASSSEKVKHLEKILKHKSENYDRKEAEIKVATAQLDAFRLENRHLRRSALNMSSAMSNKSLNETVDLNQTEAHMKELQSAYEASLGTLESQNSKLSMEMMTLRNQLLDADSRSRKQASLKESPISSPRSYKNNLRRADLPSANRSYEEKIEQLQNHVSVLERELDSRNSSLSRIGLEHEALAEFVTGVESVVRLPDSQHNGRLFNSDEDIVDSAEVATSNFLAEQDRRTAELERRLNSHIQDLKLATEGSL